MKTKKVFSANSFLSYKDTSSCSSPWLELEAQRTPTFISPFEHFCLCFVFCTCLLSHNLSFARDLVLPLCTYLSRKLMKNFLVLVDGVCFCRMQVCCKNTFLVILHICCTYTFDQYILWPVTWHLCIWQMLLSKVTYIV